MRMGLARQLLALVILLAALQVNDASLGRLFARQSGEGEQESTTPKVQEGAQQQAPNGAQPPRLYPDLPRQPNFLPPFNAPPASGYQSGPLVPFGFQMPPASRLNADQQPGPFGRMPPQPRPMTPAERLQSQSFANGLGRRLLSMIGVHSDGAAGARAAASTQAGAEQQPGGGMMDETMRALQNSSVLQQLNQGVHSIYGGLSKMYNSTIQEQLNLLQERFKAETANTTSPWHQRMAQQVPAFFKQVVGRVEGAQEQLNRVWRDLSQANSSTLSRQAAEEPRAPFFNSFDHFLPAGPDFFGRAFEPSDQPPPAAGGQAANRTSQMHEMAQKLRMMWQRQVEPELMNIRGHVSRVWRDLMGSGAIASDAFMRTRQNGLGAGQGANSSSDLVDSILKEVDVSSPEYTLIDAKGEPATAASSVESASSETRSEQQQDANILRLSPQMQNRVVEMQSELNRLWMGLMNSLQAATANVRRSLNPQPQFEFMSPMESRNRQQQQQQLEAADPKQNEIGERIKELAKLQRDADMVHDAVQQQQHETQQRQSIGDRFRGFFNNVDMRNINQLPDRIGEQFNRFGNAVGNFWNRLPEHWDNFMTNGRPPAPTQMGGGGGGDKPAPTTSAAGGGTSTTVAPSERR